MNPKTYTDFSAGIHQHYFGKRAPTEAAIEVTRRCPLACLHCYNNLPMGDLEARNRELSCEEHKRLLDELAEMGCLWLLFTGGEIFARKDFLEIYTHAKKKGFLITLFTNGILISEKIADHLAEWRPFAIEITLYGRTRETYEALTAIPGSYDRCLRGIELLKERNLPLKLKTVPTSINKHEVFAMRDFAGSLGVDFKFDPMINPRIDCSLSPLAVRLLPEEAVALDMHDPKRASEWKQLLERGIDSPAGNIENNDEVYFCGGGMNSFAINAYGEMSICVISQQELYDWRKGSVRDGWDNFLLKVRTKKQTRLTKCKRCRIQSLCSMCPATGELENGDPESPVDFLCQTAHLRVMSLGFEVPEHGPCECCAGGRYHEDLVHSAVRIQEKQIDVGAWTAPSNPFSILKESSEGSGCSGGCGHG